MKKLILTFFLLSFLLAACDSVGDRLVAEEDVRLVADWNAPTIVKPVSCVLQAGEEVEIVEISTLFMGSSERETIYFVASLSRPDCSGWGFPSQFKRKKD